MGGGVTLGGALETAACIAVRVLEHGFVESLEQFGFSSVGGNADVLVIPGDRFHSFHGAVLEQRDVPILSARGTVGQGWEFRADLVFYSANQDVLLAEVVLLHGGRLCGLG